MTDNERNEIIIEMNKKLDNIIEKIDKRDELLILLTKELAELKTKFQK